jgi:hypothetical protein
MKYYKHYVISKKYAIYDYNFGFDTRLFRTLGVRFFLTAYYLSKIQTRQLILKANDRAL